MIFNRPWKRKLFFFVLLFAFVSIILNQYGLSIYIKAWHFFKGDTIKWESYTIRVPDNLIAKQVLNEAHGIDISMTNLSHDNFISIKIKKREFYNKGVHNYDAVYSKAGFRILDKQDSNDYVTIRALKNNEYLMDVMFKNDNVCMSYFGDRKNEDILMEILSGMERTDIAS